MTGICYQLYSIYMLTKIPNLGAKENTNSGKFNISKKEIGEEIIIIRYDIYWYTGKCIAVEVINYA